MITHLAAFLIGAMSGAAGQYFATKYTEQRHSKEHTIKSKKQFEHLKDIMPKLFDEMVEDISNDKTRAVREFFVTRSFRSGINSDKHRFLYYEDKHQNLRGKIDLLESNSYVTDVTTGNVPIYRMSEEFVDLLLKYGKKKPA